jgi:hypothetical protein
VTQNISHAVMSQRHEVHDSLDHFPTPPWATRALCEWLCLYASAGRLHVKEMGAWEPACAEGHMARALAEYFSFVGASDVHDYGFGERQDFLLPDNIGRRSDWIITNPPFRLAEQFAKVAIERATHGVALLVRTAFLESASRYEGLFRFQPPTNILQFVERVPMFKGRLNRQGSTATAYCWLVWTKHIGRQPTRFDWLAPCRKRLERDSDYPTAGDAA